MSTAANSGGSEQDIEPEDIVGRSGLKQCWSFGVSSLIRSGVHELGPVRPHTLLYASAQTALLYDYVSGEQTMLLGHSGAIGSVALSSNKEVCATSDAVPRDDALLVIWQTQTGAPLRIIPEPRAATDIALSADGRFVALLTATSPQHLVIFQWTVEEESDLQAAEMLVSRDVNGNGEDAHHHLRFNDVDPTQLVSSGNHSIVFWKWDRAESCLIPDRPRRGLDKLQHNVGDLVASVHIPFRSEVVTGTSSGELVLWDIQPGLDTQATSTRQTNTSALSIPKRDAVKTIRVTKRAGVSIVDIFENYVVIGAKDGSIRFYDFQFRIVGWFEDLHAGPVTSISFSHLAQQPPNEVKMDTFEVPEFIVATSHGQIVRMSNESMNQKIGINQRGFLLVKGFDSTVSAMSTHPRLPFLSTGTTSGICQLIHYEDKTIVAQRRFGNQVTSLAFDHEGSALCVGLSNGTLQLLSADSLSQNHEFEKIADDAIIKITWSQDDKYLATADAANAVALYRFYYHNEDKSRKIEWIFVGRYISHFDSIIDLRFEPVQGRTATQNDLGQALDRLISIGKDRVLQEYNILQSSISSGLLLLCSTRLDQECVPTAVYSQPFKLELSHDTIVVASNDLKLRKFAFPNSSKSDVTGHHRMSSAADSNSPICVRTVLAPCYGSAVKHVQRLSAIDSSSRRVPINYAIYANETRLVGLMKLPLDGSASQSTAVLAHDSAISAIAVSNDSRFLFSAGVGDRGLNMFNIELDTFEYTIASGLAEEDAFNELIGGRNSELYQEASVYFYYAQLRQEGERTTSPRRISHGVSVEQLVPICNSLGFYPSMQEIQNMKREIALENDVGFDKCDTANLNEITIDLDQVIRLFVNYRPVEELTISQIEEAFHTLQGDSINGDNTIDKHVLAVALEKYGEHMPTSELEECVSSLMSSEKAWDRQMQQRVSAAFFAEDVLGLEIKDDAIDANGDA